MGVGGGRGGGGGTGREEIPLVVWEPRAGPGNGSINQTPQHQLLGKNFCVLTKRTVQLSRFSIGVLS